MARSVIRAYSGSSRNSSVADLASELRTNGYKNPYEDDDEWQGDTAKHVIQEYKEKKKSETGKVSDLVADMKENGYQNPELSPLTDTMSNRLDYVSSVNARKREEHKRWQEQLDALQNVADPDLTSDTMASYAQYKNTVGAQLAGYDNLSDDVKSDLGNISKTKKEESILGFIPNPFGTAGDLENEFREKYGVNQSTLQSLEKVHEQSLERDDYNDGNGDGAYEQLLQDNAQKNYKRTYKEEIQYANDQFSEKGGNNAEDLRKDITQYLNVKDTADADKWQMVAELQAGSGNVGNDNAYAQNSNKAAEVKQQLMRKYNLTDDEFEDLAYYGGELDDYDRRQDLQEESQKAVNTGNGAKDALGVVGNSAMALSTTMVGGATGLLENAKYKMGIGYRDKHSPMNVNSDLYTLSNINNDMKGAAQERVSDFNKVAGMVYGAGMSAAESAQTALLAPGGASAGAKIAAKLGLGAKATKKAIKAGRDVAGLVPFAVNTFTTTMSNNISDGMEMDDAFRDAMATTAIEVITELFSLDKVLDIASGDSRLLRNVVAEFAASSIIEGTEEMAGDALELGYDYLAHGNNSDFNKSVQAYMQGPNHLSEEDAKKQAWHDWRMQVIEDGITGAMSGAMGGAGATAIGIHNANTNARNTFEGFTKQDYADLAADIDSGEIMTNGLRKRSAESKITTDENGVGYGDVEDLTYGDVDETNTEDPEVRWPSTSRENTQKEPAGYADEPADIEIDDIDNLTKDDSTEVVDTEVKPGYAYLNKSAQQSANIARELAEKYSKQDTVSAKEQRRLYDALNDMWETETQAQQEKAENEYDRARKDLKDAADYIQNNPDAANYAIEDIDLPDELQASKNSYTAKEIHKQMANSKTADELRTAVTNGLHSDNYNTRVHTLGNLENLAPMLESKGVITEEELAAIKMTDSDVHTAGYQGTEISGLSNRQQQIYNLGAQRAIEVRTENNRHQINEMRGNAASILTDAERTIYENGYQSGMNAALYDRVIKTVSAAARSGVSEDNAISGIQDYLELIGGDQTQLSETVHKIYSNAINQSISDAISETARAIGEQQGVRFGTGTFTDSRNDSSQVINGIDTLEAVAKITGLNVVLVDDGTAIGHSQGLFASENSTIYLNAGKASQIASTLYHEVGEFTSVYSPEEFQGFVKSVNRMMLKQLGTAKYNEIREDYLRRYAKEAGKTDADLDKEIACDMLYQFLGSKKGMSKLIDSIDANNSVQQATTIKQKLADWIGKLAQSLKDLFAEFKPSASQKKVADAQIAQYEELVDMLNQSIAKAVSNYQQNRANASANVVSETTSTQARNSLSEEDIKAGRGTIENYGVMDNGTLRLSEATYEDGGREFLRNWLDNNAVGLTDAQKDDIIDRLDWAYKIVKDLSRSEFQYYNGWAQTRLTKDRITGMPLITMTTRDGKPIKSVAVNNGDYQLNIDFSQICKKRSTLNAVINSLVEDYGLNLPTLTESDVNTINQIIKERGYEIACGLCFVDAKRYRVGKWAESFTGEYVSTRMVDGKEKTIDATPKRKKDGWNDIVQLISPKDKSSNVGFSYFNFATDIPNTTSDSRTMDQMSDDELDLSRLERKIGMFALKDENGNVIRDENGKLVGIGGYIQPSGKRRNPTEGVKMAWAIYDNPANRRMLSKDDIISSDGLDAIREQNTDLYALVNAHWGAGKPKLPHGATAYGNEILRSSTWGSKNNFDPETARMVGGVRVQSFSDYEANMFFDYCQMFADMSARKLTSHAYTKEVDYVRLFGMTGQKINMSIVARAAQLTPEQQKRYEKFKSQEAMLKDAEFASIYETSGFNTDNINNWAKSNGMSGKPIREIANAMSEAGVPIGEILLTEDETFDLGEALALQRDSRYADNCGIIWIGISDEQIRFMLDSDDVPMIIPYHSSGVSMYIKKARNLLLYKDYQPYQTTKGTNGKALAASKEFDFYKSLYETNDPKATADEYLAWCSENGYTPKFNIPGIVDHLNYYKLLIDFKVYDYNGVDPSRTASRRYLPQQEIRMAFPKETNQIVVDSLKRQQATIDKLNADFADQNEGILTEISDRLGLTGKSRMRMSEGEVEELRVSREPASTVANHDYSYKALTGSEDVDVYAPASLGIKALNIREGLTAKDIRKDIILLARQNISAFNKKYGFRDSNNELYNNDLGEYIVMGKPGLNHILNRSDDLWVDGAVPVNAPAYILNSKVVNELNGERGNADSAYVLMGAYIDGNGLHVVRSVVNHYDNQFHLGYSQEVLHAQQHNKDVLSVLKQNTTKKEDASHLSAEESPERAFSLTSSKITVQRLLEACQENYPNSLSRDVAKHLGYEITKPDFASQRFSIGEEDSAGGWLTDVQREYFKDSKAVDDDGRLKVMYHGTTSAGFTVFDPAMSDDGIGLFFTDNDYIAGTYSDTSDTYAPSAADGQPEGSRRNYQVYLDLKNPMVVDYEDRHWNEGELRKRDDVVDTAKAANKALSSKGTPYGLESYIDQWINYDNRMHTFETYVESTGALMSASAEGRKAVHTVSEMLENELFQMVTDGAVGADVTDMLFDGTIQYNTRDYVREAKTNGYDGVIFKNIIDEGPYSDQWREQPSTVMVAFNSNQVKSVNNQNPTEDIDIRRSMNLDENRNMNNEQISEDRDKQAAILDKGTEALKGTKVNDNLVNRITDNILNRTSSAYDRATLNNNLRKTLAYLHSKGNVNKNDLIAVMQDVVRPVIDAAYTTQASREDYAQFRNAVGSKSFSISEEQRKAIRDAFGSMATFERYYPDIHISENTPSLTSQWSDLVGISRGLMESDVEESDMPGILADTFEALRPSMNDFEDQTQAAYELALETISDYLANYHNDGATKGVINEMVDDTARKLKASQKEWKKAARERYDERLKEERKRLRDQSKERVKAVNDRKDEQIARLRAKNATRVGDIYERQRKREQLRNIRKTYKRLYDYATKPTDQKHIPTVLEEPVYNLLAAFDMSGAVVTQGEDGKWHTKIISGRKYDDATGKYKYTFEEISADTKDDAMRQYNEALERGLGTRNGREWYNRMQQVNELYKGKAKAEKDGGDISQEMSDVYELLSDELADEFDQILKDGASSKATLTDLSSDQLRTISDVFRNVMHAVNYVNKSFTVPSAEVRQMAYGVIDKSNNVAGRKTHNIELLNKLDDFMGIANMNPHTYMHVIGADRMIDVLIYGQNTKAARLKQAQEYGKELFKDMSDAEFADWNKERTYLNGKVKATPFQIINIYNAAQRPDAAQHFPGGFRMRNQKGHTSNDVYYLTSDEIRQLTDTLTAKQIRIADGMQQFLANDCADWNNQTSEQIYGYSHFGDPHYWTITTDKTTVRSNPGELTGSITNSVKNMGMTKAIKQGANNPLIIDSAFDVYVKHINDSAVYSSWAAPLQDMLRFFNYKEIITHDDGRVEYVTTKNAIRKLLGDKGNQYFTKLYADIQHREQSSFEDPGTLDIFTGNAKKAATMANIRVALQQPTAIMRAGKSISYEYLEQGVRGGMPGADTELKRLQQQMIGTDMVYWIKQQGNIDGQITTSFTEQVTGFKGTGYEKVNNQITEAAGWLPGYMDQITWEAMYRACIAEQIDVLGRDKIGTQEFQNAVNNKFDHLMLETQVYDGTITRPQFMRSADKYAGQLTAFMAEPLKTYNLVLSDAIDLMQTGDDTAMRKVASKAMRKTLKVLAITAVTNAAAQSFQDAMRNAGDPDDEDDLNFIQRFFEAMGWDYGAETWQDQLYAMLHGNLADNIYLWNNVPIINSVAGKMDNMLSDILFDKTSYTSSDSLDSQWYSHLDDWRKSMENTFTRDQEKRDNSTKTGYDLFAKTARVISDFTGVPVYSAQRDLVALYNTVIARGISGGRLPVILKTKTSDKRQTKNDVYKTILNSSDISEVKAVIDEAASHSNTYKSINDDMVDNLKDDLIETYKRSPSEATKMINRIAEMKAYCGDQYDTPKGKTHSERVEYYKKKVKEWLE